MRVSLSTYDARGGVEPLAALAVRLQALGAEALVCPPPDCAERLAEVNQQALFGRVAATLLLDAWSRERPPVPA